MEIKRHKYGLHPSEFVDVYTPDAFCAETKIFVIIHGGFWKYIYGLDIMKKLCAFLCERDHIVINVEYPRVGDVEKPTQESIIKSIMCAYNYVNTIDTSLPRIIIGHSVGGQLAMLLGMRHGCLERHFKLPKNYIKPSRIIALAPVCNLWRGYCDKLSDEGDAVKNFVRLNKIGDGKQNDYNTFSPIMYQPECNMDLIHGYEDKDVPIDYSREFYNKWKHTGRVRFFPEVTSHMRLILPANPIWKDIMELIAA